MRRVFRDNQEISLGETPGRPPINRRAREVFRIGALFLDELAADHDRSRSIDHIHEFRFPLMNRAGAYTGAVLQVRSVGREHQNRFQNIGLAFLVVALCFREQGHNVRGSGECFRRLVGRLRGRLLRHYSRGDHRKN